jgi:hypothetical protein
VSLGDATECHSVLGEAAAAPPAFRAAVAQLFAAMQPGHPDHAEVPVAGGPLRPGFGVDWPDTTETRG